MTTSSSATFSGLAQPSSSGRVMPLSWSTTTDGSSADGSELDAEGDGVPVPDGAGGVAVGVVLAAASAPLVEHGYGAARRGSGAMNIGLISQRPSASSYARHMSSLLLRLTTRCAPVASPTNVTSVSASPPAIAGRCRLSCRCQAAAPC